MKILTWNILASEWVKKSYYPTVKDHSLFEEDKRIKIIIKKIKEIHADIVMLQEVMEQEYDTIYKQFHKEYHCSSLRTIQWSKSKTSSGNVTLLKKAMFKKWSEIPIDYGIYVNADNLSIFNVHLDDVSPAKRRKQLSDIRPFLEKEKYAVIAGDFNQAYKKGTKLYEIPNFTVHNECNTYFVEKNMNIDNILTKGFMETSNSCMYVPQSVEEGLQLYGSDHIPVIANVY